MSVDPVCGMTVDDSKAKFQAQFAGKKYFSARRNAEGNSTTIRMNTPSQPRRKQNPEAFSTERAPATRVRGSPFLKVAGLVSDTFYRCARAGSRTALPVLNAS
jgi:hypothetical protein